MAAIELVKPGTTRERHDPKLNLGERVRDRAVERGLMVRAVGDTIILSPPLIWTRTEIDLACQRLASALDAAIA